MDKLLTRRCSMNVMNCCEYKNGKNVSLGTPVALKSPQALHFTNEPFHTELTHLHHPT